MLPSSQDPWEGLFPSDSLKNWLTRSEQIHQSASGNEGVWNGEVCSSQKCIRIAHPLWRVLIRSDNILFHSSNIWQHLKYHSCCPALTLTLVGALYVSGHLLPVLNAMGPPLKGLPMNHITLDHLLVLQLPILRLHHQQGEVQINHRLRQLHSCLTPPALIRARVMWPSVLFNMFHLII